MEKSSRKDLPECDSPLDGCANKEILCALRHVTVAPVLCHEPMIRTILIFCFPRFLLALEVILRLALKVDSTSFVGPTLAGTGIGLALSFTNPKEITLEFPASTQRTLAKKGSIVFNRLEWRFIKLVWIVVFVVIIVWFSSVYCSIIASGNVGWHLGLSMALGVINYGVSLTLPVVKRNLK